MVNFIGTCKVKVEVQSIHLVYVYILRVFRLKLLNIHFFTFIAELLKKGLFLFLFLSKGDYALYYSLESSSGCKTLRSAVYQKYFLLLDGKLCFFFIFLAGGWWYPHPK